MRDPFVNPFPASDTARHQIWEMLVARDIDAFLAADWSAVAGDFVEDGFIGIDGRKQANPDRWRLAFPRSGILPRGVGCARPGISRGQEFGEDPRSAIFATTTLEEIEIEGETALVRKKFDGGITRADGTRDIMAWQTLYYCRLHQGRWKISGFTGYLPNPMG